MPKAPRIPSADGKRLTVSPPLNKAALAGIAVAEGNALRRLAQECFEISISVLLELGLSRSDTAVAIKHALRGRNKSKPSLEILGRYSQVGDMLSLWRRDKRYSERDGVPKVIPIYGKGATFERLARKCAPGIPVKHVLDIALHQCDVTLSTKKTVALVGSNVLIFSKKPHVTMAALNDNLRNLAMTLTRNVKLPAEKKSQGFFQRRVSGFMTEKEFLKVAQALRPQLQDLCDIIESAVDTAKGTNRSKRFNCGASLYLFQDPSDYYSSKERMALALPRVKD